MTTAADVVTRALREIGVLSQADTATAFQGTQGFADLKAMISEWELDGIAMGDGVSTWTTTTDLPYPENHTNAIMYNLALRSAAKFGRVPKDTTVAFAQKGYRALQAAYGSIIDMDVDTALRPRGRYPSGGYY